MLPSKRNLLRGLFAASEMDRRNYVRCTKATRMYLYDAGWVRWSSKEVDRNGYELPELTSAGRRAMNEIANELGRS